MEITAFEKRWNKAKETPFVKLAFLMLVENLRKNGIKLTIEHLT